MSFTGDQHSVARTGMLNGPANRLLTVDLDIRLPPAGKAAHNICDDRFGSFRSRIVAGDDRQIGQRGGPSQQGPLELVTVAAGAEDANDASLREWPQRRQAVPQRVFGMSIIDEDGKRLTRVDELQAAGYGLQRANA